jgi:hypothetical protein
VLYPVGEWEDFDEGLWSESMQAHIEEDWRSNLPFDPYRVLYVNEKRWCTWQTSRGDQMLPEALGTSLNPRWGELSLYETGTMASGGSRSILGLLSPATAVAIANLDSFDDIADEYAGYLTVGLHRRDGTVERDARIVADWLLGSPVPWYFYKGGNYVDPMLFVQLFVEATVNAKNGQTLWGEDLAEAAGYDLSFRDTGSGVPSSEFALELNVAHEVIDAALDLIAEKPEFQDIVTAARDPESPAARARDARIEAMYEPDEREP